MQLITYYPNGIPYIVEERVFGIRIYDVLIHNGKGEKINTLSYRKQIYRITYRQNGVKHNLHGPACIEWYENGKIYNIEYCQNGKKHNLHGPAYIHWSDGRIKYIDYYYNGKLTKELI